MKFRNRGFTLVEVLVAVGIIALLMGIIAPVAQKARAFARSTVCVSNLHQVSIAFEMYLNEHERMVFPRDHFGQNEEGTFGKFHYFGFEPAESLGKGEGERTLDRTLAKLYPYVEQYDSIEICPAFPYGRGDYKPKFTTRWMTYGINGRLSQDLTKPNGRIVSFDFSIKSPADAVLFADSAQVNYWQAPASPENPMYEEWHYVSGEEPTVHFRHNGRANVLFCDGHVGSAEPEPDSITERLGHLNIGCLPESVKFE